MKRTLTTVALAAATILTLTGCAPSVAYDENALEANLAAIAGIEKADTLTPDNPDVKVQVAATGKDGKPTMVDLSKYADLLDVKMPVLANMPILTVPADVLYGDK